MMYSGSLSSKLNQDPPYPNVCFILFIGLSLFGFGDSRLRVTGTQDRELYFSYFYVRNCFNTPPPKIR